MPIVSYLVFHGFFVYIYVLMLYNALSVVVCLF